MKMKERLTLAFVVADGVAMVLAGCRLDKGNMLSLADLFSVRGRTPLVIGGASGAIVPADGGYAVVTPAMFGEEG